MQGLLLQFGAQTAIEPEHFEQELTELEQEWIDSVPECFALALTGFVPV